MVPMHLTTSDLAQLRSFGTGLFRPVLAADADAFDIHWDIAKKLAQPRLRLEVWGCLIEAQRQNRRVKTS